MIPINKMSYEQLLSHVTTQADILNNKPDNYIYSRDELYDMCRLLRKYLDEQYNAKLIAKESLQEPALVHFQSSEKLAALHAKMDEYRNMSRRERGNKVVLVAGLLAEIKALHFAEKESFEKSREENERRYKMLLNSYHGKLSQMESELNQIDVSREHINSLQSRLGQLFDKYGRENNAIKQHTVMWKFLPRGKWSLAQLKEHFTNLKTNKSNCVYDLSRLDRLETLRPSECYIGLSDFEGYIVFCFQDNPKVVLENPIYGNAIYIIEKDWQKLSQLSKLELLMQHKKLVKRIIHRGNWFDRLKHRLLKATTIA